MTDKPLEPDKLDHSEAVRRFNETLGRLVNTPPKPHKAEPKHQRGGGKPPKV